jgi:hypothetical protein
MVVDVLIGRYTLYLIIDAIAGYILGLLYLVAVKIVALIIASVALGISAKQAHN